MSSISSGSDASAQDTDVKADGLAGAEDVGAPQVVVEDVDDGVYFQDEERDGGDGDPSTLEDELDGELLDGDTIPQDDATP